MSCWHKAKEILKTIRGLRLELRAESRALLLKLSLEDPKISRLDLYPLWYLWKWAFQAVRAGLSGNLGEPNGAISGLQGPGPTKIVLFWPNKFVLDNFKLNNSSLCCVYLIAFSFTITSNYQFAVRLFPYQKQITTIWSRHWNPVSFTFIFLCFYSGLFIDF